MRSFILCCTASWLIACRPPSAPAFAPPDLIVIGEVHANPPAPPRSMALLIRGGEVRGMTSPDMAMSLQGPHTKILEAPVVTPGFVDAHAHPVGLGKQLARLDLVDVDTYAEVLARIERAASSGTGWLVGRGWDQNDWPDVPAQGWPLATDLSARVPDRPVYLSRIDGHAAWLNEAALAAAHIDASTLDPVGGRILRDIDGNPTGVLIDNAMELVDLPAATDEELEAWLRAALDEMASKGLTGAHAMGMSDQTLRIYTTLDDAGELPLKIWAYVSPNTQAARRLVETGPWEGTHLSVRGVKAFADGALGSRGAWLSSPYDDEPGHAGLPMEETSTFVELASALRAKGAQLAVHAIGDAAVHQVLDAFEAAREANPDPHVRMRVEHAQVVHPDDRSRFAEMDVVASMQPTHATSDMPWAPRRLGTERTHWAYSWRTLSDAGAPLAFGSDFPVERPDPDLGLWAATTRTDLEGNPPGGWTPEERLSIGEAIAGFTRGAAYAVGAEEELGTLEIGMLADLTLWESDGDRWTPIATIVDGAIVWERPRG